MIGTLKKVVNEIKGPEPIFHYKLYQDGTMSVSVRLDTCQILSKTRQGYYLDAQEFRGARFFVSNVLHKMQ